VLRAQIFFASTAQHALTGDVLRLLAFALLIGPALAGPALAQAPELRLEGELPFSAEELQAAVALRFGATQAALARTVTVRGSGTDVVLEQDERQRTLALGEARGPAAARLVALALLDLALLEPASVAPQPPQAAPRPAAPTPAPAREHAVADGDRGWTRLALSPSVGKGLGSLEPWTYAVGVGVSRGFPAWLLEADLGWWSAPSIERNAFSASWHAVRARVQAGRRFGVFEWVGGPSVVPLWVSGGDGYDDVLFAIGTSLRAALPIGRYLEGSVALGVDVFPHRLALQAHGASVIATPHVAPFFGIGVGWRSS
jgi:hypothetical protein